MFNTKQKTYHNIPDVSYLSVVLIHITYKYYLINYE